MRVYVLKMSDCSGNIISSSDNSKCCKQEDVLRLYSREECESIDGIWHANGECTKKTGGSYSWDNRRKLGIQLYTKDECDALVANGECLKKNGGSYSWDNRPIKVGCDKYVVQVSLDDSTHIYKSAKSVTVRDVSGNVLFSTERGESV